MDWKQLGSVSLCGLAAAALWWAAAKAGAPTEYTTPAAIALATYVVGYLRSYRKDGAS
jgi:hypothetical protein